MTRYRDRPAARGAPDAPNPCGVLPTDPGRPAGGGGSSGRWRGAAEVSDALAGLLPSRRGVSPSPSAAAAAERDSQKQTKRLPVALHEAPVASTRRRGSDRTRTKTRERQDRQADQPNIADNIDRHQLRDEEDDDDDDDDDRPTDRPTQDGAECE